MHWTWICLINSTFFQWSGSHSKRRLGNAWGYISTYIDNPCIFPSNPSALQEKNKIIFISCTNEMWSVRFCKVSSNNRLCWSTMILSQRRQKYIRDNNILPQYHWRVLLQLEEVQNTALNMKSMSSKNVEWLQKIFRTLSECFGH